MRKKEKIDLVVLLIYPIFATLFSLLIRPNAFFSVVIFFAAPAVYLSFRAKQHIKKSIIFSIIIAIPFMMVIDYISHKNLQWLIPNSILPYRLFGIVTIEILFWAVSLAYFIIMFYEYFLDKHITKKLWAPKLKYLIIIGLILLSAFILIYFINPSVFNIPYFYVIFGTGLFLIPVILELSTHTRLAAKFFRTAAYFSYLTFLYEVTALKLGWWSFPGTEFIGWINIFGVSFPIEELFFWIMLTALACLSWYEFFDDDQK